MCESGNKSVMSTQVPPSLGHFTVALTWGHLSCLLSRPCDTSLHREYITIYLEQKTTLIKIQSLWSHLRRIKTILSSHLVPGICSNFSSWWEKKNVFWQLSYSKQDQSTSYTWHLVNQFLVFLSEEMRSCTPLPAEWIASFLCWGRLCWEQLPYLGLANCLLLVKFTCFSGPFICQLSLGTFRICWANQILSLRCTHLSMQNIVYDSRGVTKPQSNRLRVAILWWRIWGSHFLSRNSEACDVPCPITRLALSAFAFDYTVLHQPFI